ncbi:MAG TPA: hypothetical protein VNQ33_09065 [Acidimicrobiales bacterium]|nr:hypothetical protein [Acidimicrobiales bacterium]
MTTTRVTVTIDEAIATELRERVGRRGVSAYVEDALVWQLQRDRLGEFLAQAEEESGPLSDEELEEAAALWRRDPVRPVGDERSEASPTP